MCSFVDCICKREKNKEMEMAANVVLLSDDCAGQCADFPSLGVGGGQEQV